MSRQRTSLLDSLACFHREPQKLHPHELPPHHLSVTLHYQAPPQKHRVHPALPPEYTGISECFASDAVETLQLRGHSLPSRVSHAKIAYPSRPKNMPLRAKGFKRDERP